MAIKPEDKEWDGQSLHISGLWGDPDDMDPQLRAELKMARFKVYLAEVRKKSKP
jgi:hypothetical protein